MIMNYMQGLPQTILKDTLRSRRFCPKQDGGFTLIEILVVIVIVGVMAGVVLVSVPSFLNYADVNGESKRIRLLLNMLRDEAIIQGREFGFKPETDKYSFYHYDDAQQTWEILEYEPFKPRRIADGLSLSLKLEQQFLSGKSASTPGSTRKEMPPVLIWSSGDMTPFELHLEEAGSDLKQVLVSDGYANLTWQDSQS